MIGKGIGIVGKQRKNRDHSDYNIVEIGQNSQKGYGDMGDFFLLRHQ